MGGWWFSRGLGRQKSQPRRDLLASSLSRVDGLRRHEAVPVSGYQQCLFKLVSVIGCCCANDDDFDKVILVLLEQIKTCMSITVIPLRRPMMSLPW